jgi:hypothetical protein
MYVLKVATFEPNLGGVPQFKVDPDAVRSSIAVDIMITLVTLARLDGVTCGVIR